MKAIPKALKPAAKDHKKLMHKVRSLHTLLLSSCQENSDAELQCSAYLMKVCCLVA